MLPVKGGLVRESSSLAEAFDRMLDRGIVIDAEFGLRVAGLAIASVEARIIVAGIETYLQYAEALGNTDPIASRADPEIGDDPVRWLSARRVPLHRIRRYMWDLESDS